MTSELLSVPEARQLVEAGQRLLVAGCEQTLVQLPAGNWIGGTTAYFMTAHGGEVQKDKLFVTELPAHIISDEIRSYDEASLERLPKDYPQHGCSFIIMPASSPVHLQFAKTGAALPGLFDCPLIGWVSGTHLDNLGKVSPKVFDGSTGACYSDRAVVLHATLRSNVFAKVDIVNPFVQGSGDTLEFPQSGFEVQDVFINGERRFFADYIVGNRVDTKVPLVADYSGALVNVSIQSVDEAKKRVKLYAPVFEGVQYRFAAPLGDYVAEFARQLERQHDTPAFSCNCILNFLYGGLEGKSTGDIVGPITFGEVAYILLNQTLTYVTFEQRT